MGHRPGILVSHKQVVDGGESPNRFVPVLTTEVRCYWPANTSWEMIDDAIEAACAEARLMAINKWEETHSWHEDRSTS